MTEDQETVLHHLREIVEDTRILLSKYISDSSTEVINALTAVHDEAMRAAVIAENSP